MARNQVGTCAALPNLHSLWALLVPLLTAVGLTEQAIPEPDETRAAEGSQTPSQPVSTDTICSALAPCPAVIWGSGCGCLRLDLARNLLRALSFR
jgi:hypothetical protein